MWVRKVIARIQNHLHPKTIDTSEEEEEVVVDDEPECSESISEPSNIGSSCDSMTWLEWLTMLFWRLFGFSFVF